jgi:CHAT domain-containing protein
MRRLAVVLSLLLASCHVPPPEAYVAGAAATARSGTPAGNDSKGEACMVQQAGTQPADLPVLGGQEIFCGGWGQPAARLQRLRGSNAPAQLDMLATGGLWRTWLDQRLVCQAPQAVTLGNDTAARVLSCTRRAGGWPHLVLVAAGSDGPVLADGVAAVLPVLERLIAGNEAPAEGAKPQARSAALEQAVRQLAAGAFGAADVGRYEQLMSLGRELNQAESFAAAEDAYRAALAVQERVLGRDNPNTVNALVHLALNLSNQSRQQEAAGMFTRAALMAPQAADATAVARLAHYRALALLNGGDAAQAYALLQQAEAGYAALAPASSTTASARDNDVNVLADPVAQGAVLGLAEVWRNQAIALTRLDRAAEAPALLAASRAVLRRAGLQPGMMVARALRTEANASARLGREDQAARQLEEASRRFRIAVPGERPEAVTLFLSGARRSANGRRADALTAFRAGAAILRARQIGLVEDLVLPYLDALYAEAQANPAAAAALQAEMFSAAQLAQSSSTARFVQQASARLGAAGSDPKVGDAVRRLQDADQALRGLFAERDGGSRDLDTRIAEAQKARAEAESEVAAAAPGYRQLLLAATDADAVMQSLRPDEAMLTTLIGHRSGWAMLLRRGQVLAARVDIGDHEVTALVQAIRKGASGEHGEAPGEFDPAPARALYDALLKALEPNLTDVATLVVAPEGALLALPFGLLIAGPSASDQLADLPWLIRRHAVVHIPSAQSFVTLRGGGVGSTAPHPYIGFGDFQPATPAQLTRSFPPDRCADDAKLAGGLGRLPGTRLEVETARQLVGAPLSDMRLGTAFTAETLKAAHLDQYRIVHLATHALLPAELSCLQEPAILVSLANNAADASTGFIPASDVLNIKLNADLVVLSACNTGGPGGAEGGEALSGLARAFFYAGARGLMVTHWQLDDTAGAFTVAETLRRQIQGASTAAALRGAQVSILDAARRGQLPAEFAHPFFWAPFALIGDGRRVAL